MKMLESTQTLRITSKVPKAVALAFLKAEPRENVFLIARIRTGGMHDSKDPAHGQFLGAFDTDQSLRGLCFLGNSGTLVLSVDDPAVAGAFARPVSERGALFSICIGEDHAVRDFLHQYRREGGAEPRLDRRQPFYVVDKKTVERKGLDAIDVEQASLDSIDELTELACDMVAEDLKLDLTKVDRRHHRLRMTERVMDGRAFLSRDGQGKPIFKCDFAVLGQDGALLEGVYTPKALRRQNIASRAVWTVCRDLVDGDEIPFVALHVDERNKAARRVYEKAGFVHVRDLRLAIFPPRAS